MPERRPRYRTKDRELDRRLVEILDACGVTSNRDQLFEILVTAVRLAQLAAWRSQIRSRARYSKISAELRFRKAVVTPEHLYPHAFFTIVDCHS